MLTFRKITLADRPRLHDFFSRADGHGSEYSFVNLSGWGDQQVAFADDAPLIFSRFGDWTAYLYPLKVDLLPLLKQDARERGVPFRLWGLTAQEAAALDPSEFSVRPMRDSFDYVYDIERLCELHGKKLQSKRNHCNRFEAEHPDFQILPLTEALLPQCRAFTERWYASHEGVTEDDYAGERRAVSLAFDRFSSLCMEGLALFAEGELYAFCMGNRIRTDTFDVNFEKALADVNGAYPMINRAFARAIREKYPEVVYLNREDDMGIEGLRRAKESYHPDILLEKYLAEAVE